MGWRRVWRDVRLRRPAFDLVPDPAAPVSYRGRPFSVDRLAASEALRASVRAWAVAAGDGDAGAAGGATTGGATADSAGAALADALADALQAPVAYDGVLHRPKR